MATIFFSLNLPTLFNYSNLTFYCDPVLAYDKLQLHSTFFPVYLIRILCLYTAMWFLDDTKGIRVGYFFRHGTNQ